MCEGKRRFLDPEQARRAQRETRDYTSKRLVVYQCKCCRGFHLASYSDLSRPEQWKARNRGRGNFNPRKTDISDRRFF